MKFYKPESFSAGCKRCRTKAASSPSLSRSCLVLRTFSDTFSSLRPDKPWVTKLSSAGLVYVHFGRQLLAQLTQLKEGDRQLEVLYDKVRISLRSPSPPSAQRSTLKAERGVKTHRSRRPVLKIETTRPLSGGKMPSARAHFLAVPAKTAGSGEGGLKWSESGGTWQDSSVIFKPWRRLQRTQQFWTSSSMKPHGSGGGHG